MRTNRFLVTVSVGNVKYATDAIRNFLRGEGYVGLVRLDIRGRSPLPEWRGKGLTRWGSFPIRYATRADIYVRSTKATRKLEREIIALIRSRFNLVRK